MRSPSQVDGWNSSYALLLRIFDYFLLLGITGVIRFMRSLAMARVYSTHTTQNPTLTLRSRLAWLDGLGFCCFYPQY
ncbi:hypothetical protein [Nostoc favosum]|uniref:Uncharacterized protein n=1 Tax=Nostoc favosum CHAB5714 TaxID=2780399 RepID=A0ABS8ICB4_9NOSO|nr:hypothetical protein [Nostoc favosum]MCC5601710.1 hypothetical protein [Nostoc favosum CHAB5714]